MSSFQQTLKYYLTKEHERGLSGLGQVVWVRKLTVKILPYT
jgi:hypothetical protein